MRAGYGDPRPILVGYLLKKYGKRVAAASGFVYTCMEDLAADGQVKPVRRLKVPEAGSVAWGDANFLLMHVTCEQKGACTQDPDGKKHSVMILYNRVTGRMYLYDLFRYHQRGFKINAIQTQIRKTLLPFVEENDYAYEELKDLEKFDEDRVVSLVSMDTTDTAPVVIAYLTKLLGRDPEPREWYPLVALWEIHTMIKKPTLLRSDLVAEMMRAATKEESRLHEFFSKLTKQFAQYVAKVYKADDKRCKGLGSFWNAEIGACMGAGAGTGADAAQEDEGSRMRTESVHKKPNIKVLAKENFYRMGNQKGQLVSFMYLKYRYPGVSVYLPHRMRGDVSKTDFLLQWTWQDEEEGVEGHYEFDANEKITHAFQKALADPRVNKFIFGLRLISQPQNGVKGYHLNVLLFNKETMEVEHFEPTGAKLNLKYKQGDCYEELRKYFAALDPRITYVSPFEFLPKVDFPQAEETNELGYADEYGACAIWCMWYLELRLSNWTKYGAAGRDRAFMRALKRLHEYGSFRMFVRNFEKFYSYMIGYVVQNYLEGTKPRRSIKWDPASYVPAEAYL